MNVKDFDKIKAKFLAEGYTDFSFLPVSKEDRKKLFLQRLFHEARHQYQEELMVQTEGIGSARLIEIISEKEQTEFRKSFIKSIGKSFWKKQQTVENSIPKNSELGQKAFEFFDAFKKYNLSDKNGSGYIENLLEIDAYKNAYKFVDEKMGGWGNIIL